MTGYTPRQAPPLAEGAALEVIHGANSDDNIVELRAETELLRRLVAEYGFTHPDGKTPVQHVQFTLFDYYWANPEQARAECEAAGTPLVPGTIYLDPEDDY